MTVPCPICEGTGQIIPHNGVDQKHSEPCECWMCAGKGEVREEPTDKLIIRKYYGVMAG